MEQLGLFKLSWYLFVQEPFKAFVGVAQVLAHPAETWRNIAALAQ